MAVLNGSAEEQLAILQNAEVHGKFSFRKVYIMFHNLESLKVKFTYLTSRRLTFIIFAIVLRVVAVESFSS